MRELRIKIAATIPLEGNAFEQASIIGAADGICKQLAMHAEQYGGVCEIDAKVVTPRPKAPKDDPSKPTPLEEAIERAKGEGQGGATADDPATAAPEIDREASKGDAPAAAPAASNGVAISADPLDIPDFLRRERQPAPDAA